MVSRSGAIEGRGDMITAPCDAFSESILLGAAPPDFCDDHVAIGIETTIMLRIIVQTIIAHGPQKQSLGLPCGLSRNGYGLILIKCVWPGSSHRSFRNFKP